MTYLDFDGINSEKYDLDHVSIYIFNIHYVIIMASNTNKYIIKVQLAHDFYPI